MEIQKLKSVLSYCPETGQLVWRVNRTNNTKAGDIAGYLHTDGYRRLTIYNKKYRAHRVAWAIYYGYWPPMEIDHINRDITDNRIINLRAVSPDINAKNKSLDRRNKTGIYGVRWVEEYSKWRATIGRNGKNKHLGYFPCLIDACAARKAAEAIYGFHPNHGKNNLK